MGAKPRLTSVRLKRAFGRSDLWYLCVTVDGVRLVSPEDYSREKAEEMKRRLEAFLRRKVDDETGENL